MTPDDFAAGVEARLKTFKKAAKTLERFYDKTKRPFNKETTEKIEALSKKQSDAASEITDYCQRNQSHIS